MSESPSKAKTSWLKRQTHKFLRREKRKEVTTTVPETRQLVDEQKSQRASSSSFEVSPRDIRVSADLPTSDRHLDEEELSQGGRRRTSLGGLKSSGTGTGEAEFELAGVRKQMDGAEAEMKTGVISGVSETLNHPETREELDVVPVSKRSQILMVPKIEITAPDHEVRRKEDERRDFTHVSSAHDGRGLVLHAFASTAPQEPSVARRAVLLLGVALIAAFGLLRVLGGLFLLVVIGVLWLSGLAGETGLQVTNYLGR